MIKKFTGIKYNKSFTKDDAKSYIVFKILHERKIQNAYDVSREIVRELSKFPR